MPKSKSRKKKKPTSRPYVPRKEKPRPKPAPRWYPYFMIGLMLLGVLVIVLNYMGLMPQGLRAAWLWVGLALIAAGFMAATRYR